MREHWSPTEGRAALINPDGSIEWEEELWTPNALADEGEASILDVWLREQAHPTKFLALLEVAPTETTTMATMDEIDAASGYARQQVAAGDWSAPALDAGDMQTQAAEKVFGPNSGGSAWEAISHVAMVTTNPGNTGKFLLFLALSGSTVVNPGQSFRYTLRTKVQ